MARGVFTLSGVRRKEIKNEWEDLDNVWIFPGDTDKYPSQKYKGYKLGDDPIETKISSPAQPYEDFASDLAAGDGKIVVGARAYNSARGRVYVYDSDGSNEIIITPPDHSSSDPEQNFGEAVAIGNNKIIVGAPDYETPLVNAPSGSTIQKGAVFVYDLDGTNELKITPTFANANFNYFGGAVSISTVHNKIYVGAHLDDTPLGTNVGAVYSYNLDGTGETKIYASDPSTGLDDFGANVIFADGKLVVSAPDAHVVGAAGTIADAGQIYVYNYDGTGEVKISSRSAEIGRNLGSPVYYWRRGGGIAAGSNKIAAMDDKGTISIFNYDGTGEVIISDGDVHPNAFYTWTGYNGVPHSMAIANNKLYVGDENHNEGYVASSPSSPPPFNWRSLREDGANEDIGAIFAYDLDGSNKTKIYPGGPNYSENAGRSFGSTMATGDDGKLIVGAPGINTSMTREVYIYSNKFFDETYLATSNFVGLTTTYYPFETDSAFSRQYLFGDYRHTEQMGKAVATDDEGMIVITSERGFYVLDYRSPNSHYRVSVDGFIEQGGVRSPGNPIELNTDNALFVRKPAYATEFFGVSVAVGNGKIVIGEKGHGSGEYGVHLPYSTDGKVHVYNYDGTGHFEISAPAALDYYAQFGMSVAIADNKIAVGAPYNNTHEGAVYVYNLDGTGETLITPSSAITGSGYQNSNTLYFGWDLKIRWNKLFVTTPGWRLTSVGNYGGGFAMYNLDGTGEQFRTSKWMDEDFSGEWGNNYAGYSIAVAGPSDDGVVVIGVPQSKDLPFISGTTPEQNSNSYNGSIEIYQYNSVSGLETSGNAVANWDSSSVNGDKFGTHIAVHDLEGGYGSDLKFAGTNSGNGNEWYGRLASSGGVAFLTQNTLYNQHGVEFPSSPTTNYNDGSPNIPGRSAGVNTSFYIHAASQTSSQLGRVYFRSVTDETVNLPVDPIL